MTPEQATFLRDFLLPAIEEEHKTTKRVLAAVPDAKNDYRPDPKSRSARELAWHIAVTEIHFLDSIASASFANLGPDPDNQTKNMAELIAYYETNFQAGLEKVKRLSGTQLAKPINFFEMANLPAAAYLTWLSNHSIHHRGQLSSYLRAMGSKVPAIYGPSGDEEIQASGTANA
jgi:uncharacterized damage-inducible protein DinB